MAHSETALFKALKRHAPEVLGRLRDAPGDDDEAVANWARTHGLAYECVLRGAKYLRQWWRENPRKAEALQIVTVIEAFAVYSTGATVAEQAWLSTGWPSFKPPDPNSEVLGDWLRRAKDLFLDRESLTRFKHATRAARGQALTTRLRAYEWFVRVHVAGAYQAQVARDATVHPSQVSRDIRGVIRELKADNYRVRVGRRLGARDLKKPQRTRSDEKRE